jgi:hypothetical protein
MRALLTRAVGDLPPMPDTVPAAMHLGRRRLHRRRMAFAGGGLAVAAVVPAAFTVLPDVLPRRTVATQPGSGGVSSPPSASPSVGSTPTPRPTSPHDAYRQRVAAFLTDSLGSRLGRVTPQRGNFYLYDTDGPAGAFELSFSVESASLTGMTRPLSCEWPSDPQEVLSCRTGRLSDGTVVTAQRWRFSGAQGTSAATARFRQGDVSVRLAVERQECSRRDVPVDDADLLAAATDARFLALVQDWVDGAFPDTVDPTAEATIQPIPRVSVTPKPDPVPSPACP